MCGERNVELAIRRHGYGSSPRVRGTAIVDGGHQGACRFIPACAGNGLSHPPLRRNRPVHPRVCGERPTAAFDPSASVGSSPRVRGTVERLTVGSHRVRFIPACAGNGQEWLTEAGLNAVHPRVCGERPVCFRPPIGRSGSSPRVRGTAGSPARRRRSDRFIPACAGNGTLPTVVSSSPTVHPRVCGERRPSSSRSGHEAGSSPRVRGTGVEVVLVPLPHRFIPACAGNGTWCRLLPRWPAVHPRVCGERFSASVSTRSSGSSPRVRGTGTRWSATSARCRFIPACAGNGQLNAKSPIAAAVHPRVCGERSPRFSVPSPKRGSSPRVRGTEFPGKPRRERQRFIPACAGNGSVILQAESWTAVHPRVCGERRNPMVKLGADLGSSPRVRGTEFRVGRTVEVERFIPACAGNGRRGP